MRKVRADVKISQECIIDAVIDKLSKKNFNDISVTEICKKAGVARITFYKYYKSMEDVLDAVIENRFKMVESLSQKNNIKHFIAICVDMIEEVNKSIKSIYQSNQTQKILNQFTLSLKNCFYIDQSNQNVKKMQYDFLAGGLFNLMLNWIVSGMNPNKQGLLQDISVFIDNYVKH